MKITREDVYKRNKAKLLKEFGEQPAATEPVPLDTSETKKKSYTTNLRHSKKFSVEPRVNSATFNDATDRARGQSKEVAADIMNNVQPDGFFVKFEDGTNASITSFEGYVNKTLHATEDEAINAAKEMMKAWESFLNKYYEK